MNREMNSKINELLVMKDNFKYILDNIRHSLRIDISPDFDSSMIKQISERFQIFEKSHKQGFESKSIQCSLIDPELLTKQINLERLKAEQEILNEEYRDIDKEN